jgi:hypothetical protein
MFDPSWLDSIHPPPDPGSFPTPLADRLLDGADRLERLGEPELYPPLRVEPPCKPVERAVD